MTKTKLAIALCGLVLLGGSAAMAQGNGGYDKPDRAALHEKMKAKRIAMRQERLAKFDTNKDGKLDDNERAVMRKERRAEVFSKLDADGNGVITKSEFEQAKFGFGRHRKHNRGL